MAAVWLVYHLVQRRSGAPAGLLAALFLAVTPVSVAVDRSSNTESCLLLVLLLAAWALTSAAEAGSRRFLLLAMVLIGVAFNVKMLAASSRCRHSFSCTSWAPPWDFAAGSST